MERANDLRFGLRVPACRHPAEVSAFIRSAEDADFDVAWVPDSQFVWRDVWVTLGIAAVETTRIKLGTAVTNFESRDVTVTAAAASTVNDLAPGRFVVGVGTGDSGVKTLGRRPTRLARMREQIEALRSLLARETVTFGRSDEPYGERRMRVRSAREPQVPIYMAATGPRALALAGELADGVIVLAGAGPELVEQALGHVRHGAQAAGRDFDDIDVWLAAHTAIAEDEQAAARLVKPLVVSTAQLGGVEALRTAGIEVEVPPVAGGVYPDMSHAESWDTAIEAAERWVTDAMALRYARHYTFSGTVETVTDRLAAVVELGVRNVYVLGYSSYEFPQDLLDSFGKHVIPGLRLAEEVGP